LTEYLQAKEESSVSSNQLQQQTRTIIRSHHKHVVLTAYINKSYKKYNTTISLSCLNLSSFLFQAPPTHALLRALYFTQ